MNANETQILELIRQGEGISTEFKTCRDQISRDVYETVCAFLNRHGGTILLGVRDSGEVSGIDPDSVAQIKKDFVNTINNPQKMNPPAYLLVAESAVNGKTILRIYVPESSQVHRCNGRIYDRDLVRTNLIESYDRIIAFVQKHLPDPFYLEGIERISIRDAIFREVASNILIHREYTNAFPAKLIIERGQVRTENGNKPHGFGVLNPATFTPYPKNPVIGAFFREIHRADELGSGMRKMMKYGKAYGGLDPELVEGDVFRMIVKYPDTLPTLTPEVTPTVTPTVRVLLELLYKEGELGNTAIRTALGLKDRVHIHKSYLQPALEFGYIEMTIPDKPNSRLQKYRLTDNGLRWQQAQK